MDCQPWSSNLWVVLCLLGQVPRSPNRAEFGNSLTVSLHTCRMTRQGHCTPHFVGEDLALEGCFGWFGRFGARLGASGCFDGAERGELHSFPEVKSSPALTAPVLAKRPDFGTCCYRNIRIYVNLTYLCIFMLHWFSMHIWMYLAQCTTVQHCSTSEASSAGLSSKAGLPVATTHGISLVFIST